MLMAVPIITTATGAATGWESPRCAVPDEHTATFDRLLVVRCGAFGDMVLLTALIRPLHARLALPVDIVTSGPWSEPLLEGQPGVGEILTRAQPQDPVLAGAGSAARGAHPARARPGPTWFCDGGDAARPMLRAGIPRPTSST
jgi:hypothetical protein